MHPCVFHIHMQVYTKSLTINTSNSFIFENLTSFKPDWKRKKITQPNKQNK